MFFYNYVQLCMCYAFTKNKKVTNNNGNNKSQLITELEDVAF